jgi:diaminopimelate epimerase
MKQQSIKFTKMHGLGNDFVVINAIAQSVDINHLPIAALADRHTGIGFDQLLIIEQSTQADVFCRIFNSDGSEAAQCGNGMRCIARFIQEEKINTKSHVTIELKHGIVEATLKNFNEITVRMGIPELQGATELTLDDQNYFLTTLSLGNPHAILQVPSINTFPIKDVGPKISTHTAFPDGVNVGFMQLIDRQTIRLRTFERGAGETLACGSNSCAAVVAGIQNDLLDHQVTVQLAKGHLQIEWAGQAASVLMTGPAERVFDGICYL